MIKHMGHWVRDLLIRSKSMNATRIVAGGFAVIILMGALLLMLPIASRTGEVTDFLTTLFTATSATCVTGLIPVDTWIHWTFFGQVIILALIQLGGLGFMTIITLVSFLLHRRIGLSERLIMVSTFNLNDMDGVVRVVRHALMGTFYIEGTGAIILALRFIPDFGLLGGIWRGIFHSISAFCNAGFDLLGGKFGAFVGMAGYNSDPVILITIMYLIVVGGLGFFVWEDIVIHRSWKGLSLYSKMVLTITAGLIVGGAVFFLCVEYHNPATLGEMPLWKKILNSFFESVTLRTCGFASFDQAGLRDSSLVVGCILMLIGGSSGSTAGGMKT
ncbi:MAG: potassium transporter TrkG, partial [Pseudoflavonifractor sp.]